VLFDRKPLDATGPDAVNLGVIRDLMGLRTECRRQGKPEYVKAATALIVQNYREGLEDVTQVDEKLKQASDVPPEVKAAVLGDRVMCTEGLRREGVAVPKSR
jgi:hypothetical protein